MSTDRDTTRIVRSWLEEGVTALPDRVLDAVLDELPATPQHRTGWWPPRRRLGMNMAVAFVLAAAAVAIVAILGFRFLSPAGSSIGGPAATDSPTPSPMAWPARMGVPLASGTYLSDGPVPIRATITLPDGWIACGVGSAELAVCAGAGDLRSVDVLIVDNVVSDPCDRSRALLDPPVGDSVDDLVTAISNLSDFEATDPVDITLDGFHGQEFQLSAPIRPACVLDDKGLGTWAVPGRTNGVGPGEVNLLRIIDVDGVRVMIAGAYQASSSPDEIAEVRAIFDSVRVAP